MIKRFTRRQVPGAYLRILTGGDLGAGDEVRIVHRPAHGLTVGEVFRALIGDRELMARFLDAPELPEPYREQARRLTGSRR
jgi:MOSC domain-containing protein YiiM